MPDLKLETLLNISQIDLTTPLNQLLDEILTSVGREMQAHSGSVMLVNEETGELDMVATFGLPEDYIDRIYARGVLITCSPSGEVLKTGKFYEVQDIFEEPRDKWWADLARELGFSAQLFMPMKHKRKIIGLLNIYMAEPHEYTRDEIAFVSIAASQAAAIIEHARLYAKIETEKTALESEVGEHKRVEELLWESKEILSNILSASPIGIGIVKERKLYWTNDRMLEMMGFKPDDDPYEYVDQSAEVIYASKEEYERVGRIFYEELKRRDLVEVDAKLKRKDGSLFDGRIIMCFLDPSNPQKGAIATISDISWRKKAEEALRESEEYYRSLIENASDGVMIADERGNLKYQSPSAERIMGYNRGERVGTSIYDDIHPEDKLESAEIFRQLIHEKDVVKDLDLRIRHKDGSWRTISGTAKNLLDNPAVRGIVINYRDITERMLMGKELEDSEERFRSLFDNLSVGIAMIDREGQVLAVNKTACRFLDYSQEELIGTRLTTLIYPKDLEADREPFKPVIEGKEDHCLMDKRHVRKDGDIVWGRLHVSGIKDEEGQVKFMSVICEDITACKLVEKALLSKSAEMASVVAKCKHMKDALQRSETKYKEIAEFLPDLIYKSILLDA